MSPPPKRLKGTADSPSLASLAPAFASATASMATSHVGTTDVSSARRDATLSQGRYHPLLIPEIVAGVFQYLQDDIWSVAQSTEVCRLWWQVGHRYTWRHVQVRDLVGYVKNVTRRQYFASLVEEISFPPGDNILASDKMSPQPLGFSRLRSIAMNQTNLVGVRPANIQSLCVPTLRSFTIDHAGIAAEDEDSVPFLEALMRCRATLTTLDFSADCQPGAEPLLYRLLNKISAIEHLSLGWIAEYLHETYPTEDLLQVLLDKPRLVTLDFPHGVDFSLTAIYTFLARMGPRWSIPSLQSFGRPEIRSSPAAAYLFDRMPNLRELIFELEDSLGTWSDNLKCVFASIPKLHQLKILCLNIDLADRDMDCSCLPHLVGLHNLETVGLVLDQEGTVTLTGAQLAAFLENLPKLNDLLLSLSPLEVLCSPEEKAIIDTAIARIEKVELGGLIFTTHHTV